MTERNEHTENRDARFEADRAAGAQAEGGAGASAPAAARDAERAASAGDEGAAARPAEDAVTPDAAADGDTSFADAVEADVALADALAQVEEWKGKYLRLHADWDTYRRRMSEQRAEERLRATEKLAESLIPLLDDFERTIEYAEANGETGLLEGVRAVSAKLAGTLEKGGLVAIDPAGEPFDALQAQAVGTVPDAEAFEETVAQVYQKGYRMGGKVLRPAMVTITTGGPARPKPEESDD
ncbi:nucleotide exchange factor GrpE [Eggerthellaceae bacterium zg-1084]|uniref:nucleotide exchange factor GrpE n=1 Tax=Berryella wangjianweii TaxID=2734634 RepID=UPI001551C341|nr:nucleotide exchange factor GrpE [Berryella wangjianweii]NPD31057.1 nucleotide exchange factor GrpE [Berryella wangjianweii]